MAAGPFACDARLMLCGACREARWLHTRSDDRYTHGMLLAEGRDRHSQLEERIAVLGRYL
jgi:hypothetical protein